MDLISILIFIIIVVILILIIYTNSEKIIKYCGFGKAKAKAASNGRRNGSEDARDGAHPYQVSLRHHGIHKCGGAIIDNEFVISAAHCVINKLAENLTIVVGSNQLDTGGEIYQVIEVYIHEKYDTETHWNDIALLKVEKIAFNEKVNKIAVAKDYVFEDEILILTGWGSRASNGTTPNDLQYVRFISTNMQNCIKISADSGWSVSSSHLCAMTNPGAGAYPGDSGSPLVTQDVNEEYKLVGVTSWGNECRNGQPDVYARISSYLPFINEICRNCLCKF